MTRYRIRIVLDVPNGTMYDSMTTLIITGATQEDIDHLNGCVGCRVDIIHGDDAQRLTVTLRVVEVCDEMVDPAVVTIAGRDLCVEECEAVFEHPEVERAW